MATGGQLFSDDTIATIRTTWNKLETDGSTIGKLIFLKVFKEYPDYQSYFVKMKDVPYSDLATNKNFIQHATSVERKLHFSVNNLHETEKLLTELNAVGKKHKKFNLSQGQFENVQRVIEDTIKEALGNEYNESIKTSWNEVLSAVIKVTVSAANS